MRRLVVLLCLAAVTVVPQRGVAGCSGPTVDVAPNARRAGQLVLVTGRHWVGFCDDEGETCGCTGCSDDDGRQETERVVLELRRGGSSIPLKTVDVSETDSFALEVRLPRDLESGRYRVVGRGIPAGDEAWTPLRIAD